MLAVSAGEAIIEVRTEDGGFTSRAVVLIAEGDDNEDGSGGEEDENGQEDETSKPILYQTTSKVVEGAPLIFEFSLSKAVEESVSIPLLYENLTARADDYIVLTEELIFEAGSTSAVLEVPTVIDQRTEESETLLIRVAEGTASELLELPDILAMGTILDDDQPMSISPNPAVPFSDVSLANVQEGIYSVEIFTPSGNLQQRGTIEVGSEQPRLQIGNLARGLYILNLSGPAYSYTAKLIVR